MKQPASGVPLAEEFLAYCKQHPYLRFWQALLAWSGLNRLAEVTYNKGDKEQAKPAVRDTFYWGGKSK